jgi:hypothetical protein
MALWSTKSLLFDGVNQYASGGDVLGSVLEYNVPWSISLWRKTGGPSGMWVAKGDDSLPYKGLQFYGGSNVVVQAISAPGSAALFSTGSGLDDSAWHHVVLTKATGASVSAGNWHIYVDSVDQTLTPSQDSLTGSILTTFPFLVGEWGSVNPYPFAGTMDDVAIYNVELSGVDVAYIFGTGHPRDLEDGAAPSGLQSYWWMGEAVSVNTVPDQVGSNNLTLVNSPTVVDDYPLGPNEYVANYVPTSALNTSQFSPEEQKYAANYVPTSDLFKSQYKPFDPYGGGLGPTVFYKMRARDDGVAAPGYVTWVVEDNPDFGGAGFSGGSPTPVGSMIPGSAQVVARWEE